MGKEKTDNSSRKIKILVTNLDPNTFSESERNSAIGRFFYLTGSTFGYNEFIVCSNGVLDCNLLASEFIRVEDFCADVRCPKQDEKDTISTLFPQTLWETYNEQDGN